MFYETERIVRKQTTFVNSRAYTLIQELELKGLNDLEIKKFLEALVTDKSNTETQDAVIQFAKSVIKRRQELADEKVTIINDDTKPTKLQRKTCNTVRRAKQSNRKQK